jgi:peroxiredoxin/mono/diheme cytochrome c family protein
MRTEKSKSETKGWRFSLRLVSILLFLAILVILGIFVVPRTKFVVPHGPKAADFCLQDPRDQQMVVLSELLARKKAIVLVFLGTECVLNNQYIPVLIELHEEYSRKGVAFVGINANSQDSRESMAAHARRNAIPFPVVKDAGNKVADQLGARRTPEAFVLDSYGIIRYQGHIDDQFGIGYARAGKPTRRDLAEALDEVLAGKAVSVPLTEVAGCCIGRVAKPKENGRITYAQHVSRILQKNCQECHRPGQIAPMSLLTFDDALAWSDTIREVINEGRMPPWYADPHYGKFSNDRRLSSEEKETLLDWLDNGMARGDDKDLPPPRRFSEGWVIGEPDLVVSMPTPFEVPAKAPEGVKYQYITVDPGLKEDRWVQRAEIRPGAPSVVHHSVVMVQTGEKLDFNEPGIVLCGYGPGEMPMDLEEGYAKKIPAGAKLVFQMHYTPNGKEQSDQTRVGIIFAKKPPRHRVITAPIYNLKFLSLLDHIPAGADNYKMESEQTFWHDAHVMNFMPHMHLRGKDFLYEAIYPDGKREILLSVPRYDFNWQGIYRLAEPKAMPKYTKLHCVAHFDNSAKNPNNPDPKKNVYWGYQTWEEMFTGWYDYYLDEENPLEPGQVKEGSVPGGIYQGKDHQ